MSLLAEPAEGFRLAGEEVVRKVEQAPEYLDRGWLGVKSGHGFYEYG